ncbi:RDD family protein [Tuberibacillus sp. Marseille-P3662]|uniref:RDD family protein n=1 Tax=Tuberibacillus sp. Marseille-P3662 TaxID=1965358 RepID=UPI000A1CB6AD|nr:RDD family protein [Tuberibacillus sp. Marseille-P3662]
MTIDRPAGFWIRLVASILDGLATGIPISIVIYLITGQVTTEDTFMGGWWTDILLALYWILVPVYWHGYVIGKRAMGIRIVKVDGENVTIWTMLIRYLTMAISFTITLGIGGIVSAFMVGLRADKRSIHDLAAGTYVTHNQW